MENNNIVIDCVKDGDDNEFDTDLDKLMENRQY